MDGEEGMVRERVSEISKVVREVVREVVCKVGDEESVVGGVVDIDAALEGDSDGVAVARTDGVSALN